MRYATNDMTTMMGIGSYMGEIRQGPDGGLYEWVEGVDGLGNPVGIWKTLKKGFTQVVKKALPLTSYIPGIGPIIQKVRGGVQQFCSALPQLQPCVSTIPQAGPIFATANKVCEVLKKTGLAGVNGPIVSDSDGQLYEMVEGIGAYGEPVQELRRIHLVRNSNAGVQGFGVRGF